jgi:hypothetical protein
MKVILACAWQPRGELARFQRYLPRLHDIYGAGNIVITLMQEDADESLLAALMELGIPYELYGQWSGRHRVLRLALEHGADYIHYVDMDRLVRWVELYLDDLQRTVEKLQTVDCLFIGRTPEAYATHTRTLVDTERLVNTVFSHHFGQPMDFAAGSRGFSRRAAQLILANRSEQNSLAMDAGWAVLVLRAGLSWEYIEVDSLDWETADRYRDTAAGREEQQVLAAQQDADPDTWRWRISIAQQILDHGLKALTQPLSQVEPID